MKTRKDIYHEYLNSDEWSQLRSLAKLRNKRLNNNTLTCVDCKATHKKQYDVHHEQYPESNDYYNDDNSSFHVVLCHECHEKRHNISNDNMILTTNERKPYSFLGSHGAFISCFPEFLGLYYSKIGNIDLFEYKELFDIIKSNHLLGDSIEDLLLKIQESDIDYSIKERFSMSVEGFSFMLNKIRIIKNDISSFDCKDHKENTNDMDQLFIEMNKTILQKKLKEEQNRVEDIIEEIFKKVKIYKRKLKRMV